MTLRERLPALLRRFDGGRRLGWLLPLGALVHLGVTLLADDRSALSAFSGLRPELLLAAGAAAWAPPLLQAVRLRCWLVRLGTDTSFRTPLRIVAASEVGAAVTPSAVGGAPVKTALLMRRGYDLSTAAAVTALGVIEDLAFNVLAAVPAIMLSGIAAEALGLVDLMHLRNATVSVGTGLLLATMGGVFLLRTERGRRLRGGLRERRERFAAAMRWAGTSGRRILVLNSLLAIVQWSLRYSLLPLLALGLGIELPWLRAAVLQWVGFAASTLVPTPGATGGAEAVFVVLYRDLVPADVLPAVLSAWRLLTFYWVVGSAALTVALTGGTIPDRLRGDEPARKPGARVNARSA